MDEGLSVYNQWREGGFENHYQKLARHATNAAKVVKHVKRQADALQDAVRSARPAKVQKMAGYSAAANAAGVGTTLATTGRGHSRVHTRRKRRRRKQSVRQRLGKLEKRVPKLSSKSVDHVSIGILAVSPVGFPSQFADASAQTRDFDAYSDVVAWFSGSTIGSLLYYDHAHGYPVAHDLLNHAADYEDKWRLMKKDPLAQWMTDENPGAAATFATVYSDMNLFRFAVWRRFTFYNHHKFPVYLEVTKCVNKVTTDDSPLEIATLQLNGNVRNYADDKDDADSAQRTLSTSEFKLFENNLLTSMSNVKKKYHVNSWKVVIEPGGTYSFSMKNSSKMFNWRKIRNAYISGDGDETNEYMKELGTSFVYFRQAGPMATTTALNGIARAPTEALNYQLEERYRVVYDNGGTAPTHDKIWVDDRTLGAATPAPVTDDLQGGA